MTPPPSGSSELGPISISRMANGGEGIGHLADGRVVFVPGVVPGDVVAIDVVKQAKRFARARLVGVIEPGPTRIAPDCPQVTSGCGGCDWQHVEPIAARSFKAQVVSDALERIGRIAQAVAEDDPIGAGHGDTAKRTTVRCAVDDDGRASFRSRQSHDLVAAPTCLAAHPGIESLMATTRFAPGSEVTIRLSTHTGQRMIVLDSPAGSDTHASAQEQLASVANQVGNDVMVAGSDGRDGDGRPVSMTERVAGFDFMISALSFFQTQPRGAERLVSLVRDIVSSAAAGPAVDLYSGVGLFAATVFDERQVTAVERSGSSASDAALNLAGRASVIESRVEDWPVTPAAVVVADPARSGLDTGGVEAVTSTGAATLALVSCDVGALGRDAGLLASSGWSWQSSTVIDMFPHTSHVEVVTHFAR